MTQKDFANLFESLKERNPGMGYEYDGNDIISCPAYDAGVTGVWVDIINDTGSEELYNTCSYCFELRNANGQIWDMSDLNNEMQSVIYDVEDCCF